MKRVMGGVHVFFGRQGAVGARTNSSPSNLNQPTTCRGEATPAACLVLRQNSPSCLLASSAQPHVLPLPACQTFLHRVSKQPSQHRSKNESSGSASVPPALARVRRSSVQPRINWLSRWQQRRRYGVTRQTPCSTRF